MTGSAPPSTLVLATANPDKVAELAELLPDRYRVVGRPEDLAETVEDGLTLEANAVKKATEVVEHGGQPALADDTGLFVAALGGRPGVHTARYAGPRATSEDNVGLLLTELASVEHRADRGAEFRTVIAVVWPDGRQLVVEGAVAGSISDRERGSGGFGYDPIFVPDEGDGRTFAEMEPAEKHRLSHRGRAVAAVVEALEAVEHT